MIVRRLVPLGLGFALLLGAAVPVAAQGDTANHGALVSVAARSDSVSPNDHGIFNHGAFVSTIAYPPGPCTVACGT